MSIEAELKQQTIRTVNAFMIEAMSTCELHYGKQHVKDHPELVAAWMNAAQHVYATLIHTQMVQNLTDGLTELAKAIKDLQQPQ